MELYFTGDIFSPQIDGVSITHKISREAKKDGALVSIKHSISKKVFEILNHRLRVVYAPHRWYALEEWRHELNSSNRYIPSSIIFNVG
jgi:hypothetical protein